MTRTSRILAAASAGLMFCFAALGTQNISLTWNASTDPATAGYILHYGRQSHVYTGAINVGTNTVVTLSGLADGQTYYVMVGCYGFLGMEGFPSSEASFVVPTNGQVTLPTGNSFAVTPSSGSPGSEVDIYPANPGTVSGVNFNGTSASFTVVSNAYLAVTVPAGATTGPLNLTATSGTVSGRFTVTSVTGPANDNFANAQVLSGVHASAWTSTTGATKELGEPNHAGKNGGASVWYRWTAPQTGAFTLDTSGTEFTPLVAVYTGNRVTQLSVVASNVATSGSQLSFQALSGVTYQVAVDGLSGGSGNMMLRLYRTGATGVTSIFSETFDEAGIGLGLLAGQNGWVSTVPALSGVTANYFQGYGSQGCVGLSALGLTSSTVQLYHPLNFTIDTNFQPVIQFSVLVQFYNPFGIYRDSFGWAFRNTAGQQLFSLMFNNGNGQITYGLDDGVGQRLSGLTFNSTVTMQLSVTADFSRNEWSAWLNGSLVVLGQPITTTHAALTLDDIDAEALYPALQSGTDGMIFDNFTVTAEPASTAEILQGPQNQIVMAGNTTSLSVIAAGAPPFSYQWSYNGQAIPGATNPELWLTNMAPTQAGIYSITVASGSDSTSAGCGVVVRSSPVAGFIANAASSGSTTRPVNFNVVNGRSYRVQASTNMTSWSQVGSFYAKGTNAAYFDATASSSSRRFYRLASP